MNTRRYVPLAMLLIGGFAIAQQPPAKKEPPKETPKTAPKEPAKPAPGSLEDTLDKALRNSADIKAAEAKIRDAEAEANRVRSQVLTKAATLHTNLSVAKRMLLVAEEVFARTKTGVERAQVSQAELSGALATLEKARGEVEVLETELKSLRGEFATHSLRSVTSTAFTPDGGRLLYSQGIDGAVRVWDANWGSALLNTLTGDGPIANRPASVYANPVEATMADRVRKLLDQEIEGTFNSVSPFEAVQQIVAMATARIPVRTMGTLAGGPGFDLRGELQVGAWFQAIEDSDPKIRIVIRDYGLLLTTKDRMPEGALRIADFWKTKEAKKEEAPKK